MKELMAEFRGKSVEFFTVYVREPHAGEARFWRYRQPADFEQKLANAKLLIRQKNVRMPVLVDGMDELAHRQFGRLPNMIYVVDKDSRIVYKSMWTRVRELRQFLKELCEEDMEEHLAMKGAAMNYYGAKELAESFRTVRNNTIRVAEDIPEDKYNFSPAAETRTVEKLLTHIALGYRFQYHVQKLDPRPTLEGFNFPAMFQQLVAEEARPRTKAEVLALLRKEGEIWESFVAGLSEDFLGQTVQMPAGATPSAKSRIEMILSVKEHEMHHRGQLMLIERMIGIVPHLTRDLQARMAQAQAAQASR
ncbi:MAG: DinB family protein [Acidobacteria bacterium]|nr:DinB family protein [Acidobacteriota bacterium]